MEICVAGPAELVSNVNPSGKAGRISIRYIWGQQFNDSTCPLTQTNKIFILEQSFQVLLIKGGEGSVYYNEKKKIVAQPRKPRQRSTKSLSQFGQQLVFLGRLERDNGGCNFVYEIHPIQRVQVPSHHLMLPFESRDKRRETIAPKIRQ